MDGVGVEVGAVDPHPLFFVGVAAREVLLARK
jgi:hypothetical protein